MLRITPRSFRGGDSPAVLPSARARSAPPTLRILAGLLLTLGATGIRAADFYGDSVASGSISGESVSFHDQSSAGSAFITLSPYTVEGYFYDTSSAANASIVVDSGAVLYFDQGSTAGSSTINVVNGSFLEFNGQAKAGAASITVDGGSTVYFYGDSTPEAARLVVDGAVVLSDTMGTNGDGAVSIGSLAGTGAIEIGGSIEQNNLVVRVGGNGDSTSFIGSIYGGPGSTLVKTGSGIFTLDSSATLGMFDSAILVEQGLINFSSSAALGSGRITLNGGGLQWASGTATDISSRLEPLGAAGGTMDTNGNDVVFSSGLSGSGALTKTGAGALTLMQASSYSGGTILTGGQLVAGAAGALPSATAYTIDAGTLNLGSYDLTMAALSGSGGGIALGSATLTVAQSVDTTYAGQISGSGGLIKSGDGRLNLTGANSYIGATEVLGGTLAVNGSLSGTGIVWVRSGGTLGGNGSVGTVVVDDGGRLAPGNSIGTLYIAGDLILTPGSTYVVETDAAGNADRVVVGGMASLGGTLQVLAENGTYQLATNYPIISTSGGSPLTGQFDAITSNLAFLTPSLVYGTNGVSLTLTRNDLAFTALALTPNQVAFARSLSALPSDNAVYRTLINLSAAEAAEAFSQLSGDAHASMSSALMFSDIDVMNAPQENLRRNLDAPLGAMPMWAQVATGSQRYDDDGNAGAAVQDFNGAMVGGDLPAFGDWRIGGAIGYDLAQLKVSSRNAEGDTASQRYALYGGRDLKLGDDSILRVFGGAAYSVHKLDSSREVALVDGVERLQREYDVVTRQVFGELGYRVPFGETAFVEPFVGWMQVVQRADAFRESGGAAALAGDSQRNALQISSLGARGKMTTQIAGTDIDLNGSVTWRHLEGDVRPELGLRLSGGERYTVLGNELPRDSVLVTFNAHYPLAGGVLLNLGYNGMLSDSGNANALTLNLRWKMN